MLRTSVFALERPGALMTLLFVAGLVGRVRTGTLGGLSVVSLWLVPIYLFNAPCLFFGASP